MEVKKREEEEKEEIEIVVRQTKGQP